jgi:hypothetical protein
LSTEVSGIGEWPGCEDEQKAKFMESAWEKHGGITCVTVLFVHPLLIIGFSLFFLLGHTGFQIKASELEACILH